MPVLWKSSIGFSLIYVTRTLIGGKKRLKLPLPKIITWLINMAMIRSVLIYLPIIIRKMVVLRDTIMTE